jgi:hypothetical protein
VTLRGASHGSDAIERPSGSRQYALERMAPEELQLFLPLPDRYYERVAPMILSPASCLISSEQRTRTCASRVTGCRVSPSVVGRDVARYGCWWSDRCGRDHAGLTGARRDRRGRSGRGARHQPLHVRRLPRRTRGRDRAGLHRDVRLPDPGRPGAPDLAQTSRTCSVCSSSARASCHPLEARRSRSTPRGSPTLPARTRPGRRRHDGKSTPAGRGQVRIDRGRDDPEQHASSTSRRLRDASSRYSIEIPATPAYRRAARKHSTGSTQQRIMLWITTIRK